MMLCYALMLCYAMYRGSFARSKHVGLATLHVYRMADARSEHVGFLYADDG